jgi:serine/threonine protein kinase
MLGAIPLVAPGVVPHPRRRLRPGNPPASVRPGGTPLRRPKMEPTSEIGQSVRTAIVEEDTSATDAGPTILRDLPPFSGDAGAETTQVEPAACDDRPLVVGRRVDRFTLVETLDGGSQGRVWKAVRFDPEFQVVALKIFRSQWRLDHLLPIVKIRHEAARGGPLARVAILPILEYGQIEGRVYFVMPIVDGPPLDRVLAQRRECLAGRRPERSHRLALAGGPEYLRAMVRILARIARALADLHQIGIVHRDVKPSNILIPWDLRRRLYLSDFGVARILSEPSTTRPGLATGSTIYMPHEALRGRPEIDVVRADVYALGVTLFESLTLKRPFHIPRELPHWEWVECLLAQEAPWPRAIDPEIPEDLEAIIMKAMARRPADRYPTASALADDLERTLT